MCSVRPMDSTTGYSPDGQTILTASWDKTALIGDAATGKRIRILSGQSSSLSNEIYRLDRRTILTSSVDGTARLWDADYHDFIAFACTTTWRDFTDAERTLYNISNEPTYPEFDQSKATSTPYPTVTPIRETWTPFPLADTPEPVFIPSYTPGASPTFVPSLTPTSTLSSRDEIADHDRNDPDSTLPNAHHSGLDAGR